MNYEHSHAHFSFILLHVPSYSQHFALKHHIICYNSGDRDQFWSCINNRRTYIVSHVLLFISLFGDGSKAGSFFCNCDTSFPHVSRGGRVRKYFTLVFLGIRVLRSSVSWLHHFFWSHMPSIISETKILLHDVSYVTLIMDQWSVRECGYSNRFSNTQGIQSGRARIHSIAPKYRRLALCQIGCPCKTGYSRRISTPCGPIG